MTWRPIPDTLPTDADTVTGPADPRQRRAVRLDGVPQDTFAAAVSYLSDVLRECQLVQVAHHQQRPLDPMLAELAGGLVPDLEAVREVFLDGTVSDDGGGTVCLAVTLQVAQAATLAHLQMQLVQLRLLERRGGLLLRSDPAITQLLDWIWGEASDQLRNRPARPYRSAT